MKEKILMIFLYASLAILAWVLSASKEPNKSKIIQVSKPIDTLELVLNIIKEREGASCHTIGDSGKAYGCYQLHHGAIKDVNSHFKTNYRHKDAFKEDTARKISKLYLMLGRSIYVEKYAKEPTINQYLMMYNGGIHNGYRNKKTLKYLHKN
jgi:hypothetical protein